MTQPILAANPHAQYLSHKTEIDIAIAAALDGNRYVLGPQTQAFEQEFATYLDVRYASGVGSGTEALHTAIRACGLGPGDEIITVAQTAVATVAAIELAGATPVLVDIDPVTYTIDPDVKGTVTINSSEPLRREDLFPVFNQILRMNNAVAVKAGDNIYRIVPIEKGKGLARPVGDDREGGYAIQILPVRFSMAHSIVISLGCSRIRWRRCLPSSARRCCRFTSARTSSSSDETSRRTTSPTSIRSGGSCASTASRSPSSFTNPMSRSL